MVKRIINGNNSKTSEGEFKKDKNILKFIETFSFLKNSISLKRFKIKTRLVITKKMNINECKYILSIYFI